MARRSASLRGVSQVWVNPTGSPWTLNCCSGLGSKRVPRIRFQLRLNHRSIVRNCWIPFKLRKNGPPFGPRIIAPLFIASFLPLTPLLYSRNSLTGWLDSNQFAAPLTPLSPTSWFNRWRPNSVARLRCVHPLPLAWRGWRFVTSAPLSVNKRIDAIKLLYALLPKLVSERMPL